MSKKLQHSTSIFFIVAFLAIISTPTLILSINDNADIIEYCLGLGEEEESKEVKLLFETVVNSADIRFLDNKEIHTIIYKFKVYSKPELNLISPPPEYVLFIES